MHGVMEGAELIMAGLLSKTEATPDWKHLLKNTAASRVCKQRLAGLLIQNRDGVIRMLCGTTGIDRLVNLLRILGAVLTRKQIQSTQYFSSLTSHFLSIHSPQKSDYRRFYMDFTAQNDCAILGCAVRSLVLKFKDVRLENCVLFLDGDSVVIYSGSETIVIYHSSIQSIRKIDGNGWNIQAREDRMIEIVFEDGNKLDIAERRMGRFFVGDYVTEAEDSLSLSLGSDPGHRKELVLVGACEELDEDIKKDLALLEKGTGEVTGQRGGEEQKGAEERIAEKCLSRQSQLKVTISEDRNISYQLRQDSVHADGGVSDDSIGTTCAATGRHRTGRRRVGLPRENGESGSAARMPVPYDDSESESESGVVDGTAAYRSTVKSGSARRRRRASGRCLKYKTRKRACARMQNKRRGKDWSDSEEGVSEHRRLLGGSIMKKIERLHRERLSYNREIYKHMNQQAEQFRDTMKKLCSKRSSVSAILE